MYFTIYSSTGLPLCRASHERTIRPPAENAFHVYVDPGRGPPAWSGFPVVYKMASRMVGPPGMLTSVLLLGLLLCRASHERTIRPPAENGFHVYVDPGRGPPAWSGFPVVYKTASRMVGPPGMLTSVLLSGLLLCRASHVRTRRPPAENGIHVYVDPGWASDDIWFSLGDGSCFDSSFISLRCQGCHGVPLGRPLPQKGASHRRASVRQPVEEVRIPSRTDASSDTSGGSALAR